ncbi:MAG: DNA polymerase III subunit alpha [Candidatus Pacebacteria bacterium]|nr:DNA polymerase III subunit alpha [Candidatus Paceibacterota bacterium]
MAQHFIHLHTHSHYSLLDGLSKVDDLIARAKKNKMPALAITDHGNMYGAIEFYKKAKDAGIKPILGVEAYMAVGSRHDKNPGIDNKRFHLTLLAKNNTGYKNLIRLVTLSNTEGFYYKPRMDKEILRKYASGIVCLSGCFSGEVARALREGQDGKAESVAKEYQEIFGKENFFIEIEHHPKIENFNENKQKLIALAKRLDMPLVGTQDSHYIDPDDAHAQDVLIAIGTGVDIHNDNRLTMTGEDFSFIDTKTATEYFKDAPEAVTNTEKIADMCNVELELGKWTFPAFDIPEETTYDKELHRIAYEGIEKRDVEKTKELTDRLDYELKVIKDKGYSVYFLIVGDLLRFARENNIFTTIRGSVAGSMTTFLLGITNVNPFEYKLPFERFLNPERPSAPDIDMDFADNRRDEVLDYARSKYGEDKVAQIGTFGKMLAKGSVRDVARALGQPYSVGDKIANMIPLGSQGFPMTIERAIEMEPDLKKAYGKDPATKEIIDLAKKLEGGARHISVHAAGVVISPTPLYDFVPTQFDPKGGKIITQYDMHGVEDAGLIKFDFLGIRNLAILGDAVRLVKKFHGLDVDIEKIPVDDKKTFKMLARGETMGLFQLNGAGMTQYLKELKPTVIYDINAMVALYRPGPMESIPEYIKRKYNSKLITYLDPRLKDILDQSYGVITYQDDVMMIAIKLAGYSWLEADKLRKAMGKKIPKLMEEQKKKLLEGFVGHGLTKEKADKLWHLIEPFAAYGFNKAHAASYGRVAYQTAYMKANYPAEYMTAVLTAESGDTEKISEIISECKRMKIPVLPPSINESFGNFTVIKGESDGDNIRFGLYTIKNLGYNIADAVIKEREENGKYISFSNFLERVHHKNLNKKSLESLVKSGALDDFEERGIVLGNIENALEYNKYIIKQQETDQSSLFGGLDESTLPTFRLKESDPVSKDEMLSWEKELLGLYISGHPLDKFRDKINKNGTTIECLQQKAQEGITTLVAGIIEESKEILTKKGDKMAFVRLSDYEDTLEVVVFPRIFTEFKEILISGTCVVIKGKISKRNNELSIIVDDIKKLT